MSLAPKVKTQKRKERVLDARICVLSGCRFLQSSVHPVSGQTMQSCGAGVFRAMLPYDYLQEEIMRNPSRNPGANSDDNPFLLRLLMAEECLRDECGVAHIEYTERVIEVDPAEAGSELFL